MSTDPKRQAVLVGLLITTGASVLAGGILLIGDLRNTFTRKITVNTAFDDVGGLQEGDNVWFSGVKVGIVTDLAVRTDARVDVQMRIDRKATGYIHEDSLAKLGSDGLIGNRIVVLYGGSAEAPPLAEGDTLASGVDVSTEQILATLQDNNTNLLAITTDLRTITNRLAAGEGTVGKLLSEEVVYTQVHDTMSALNAASADARQFTSSLDTFGRKLNRSGSLPNQLVTDTTTYPALTATVDRLQRTVDRTSGLMDGIADGAADPSTPAGTLLHDKAVGEDVKGTFDNLHRASGQLADDLEAAQHNIFLRGFFRKREKAAAKARAEADAAAVKARAEADAAEE